MFFLVHSLLPGVVLGGGVVVADGVVVFTIFLIGELIVSTLASLLREGGPEDGVIISFDVAVDCVLIDIELWIGWFSPPG